MKRTKMSFRRAENSLENGVEILSFFFSPLNRPWTGMEADDFFHCSTVHWALINFRATRSDFPPSSSVFFAEHQQRGRTQRNLIKFFIRAWHLVFRERSPGQRSRAKALLWCGANRQNFFASEFFDCGVACPTPGHSLRILRPKLGENRIKRKIRSQYNRALRQNLVCATSKLNFPSSAHTGTLCRLWRFSGARIYLH